MADTRPLIPQPPLTGGRTLESASRLTRVAFKVRRGRLRLGPGWLRTGSVAHVKAARLEPRWAAPDGSGFVVSPPRLQSVRQAGTASRSKSSIGSNNRCVSRPPIGAEALGAPVPQPSAGSDRVRPADAGRSGRSARVVRDHAPARRPLRANRTRSRGRDTDPAPRMT